MICNIHGIPFYRPLKLTFILALRNKRKIHYFNGLPSRLKRNKIFKKIKGSAADTQNLKGGLHRVMACEVGEVALFCIVLRGGGTTVN